MEKVLDANIIIRFLVDDDKEKADAIEKLIRSNETLILTDLTIAEIIWVLSSYYKEPKKDIVKKITALIHLPSIKCNKKVMITALNFFEKHNIDWIDAYLAAYNKENDLKEIYSYDLDLDKIKSIKRLTP